MVVSDLHDYGKRLNDEPLLLKPQHAFLMLLCIG